MHQPLKLFETKRLLLKIYTTQDVHDVFASKTKAEIITEMGYPSEEKYLKELKRFESGLLIGKRPTLLFQIILRSTKEIIGACGFHNWFIEHNRAEIGYEIFVEQYKNKGYMTEAMQSILAYAFDTMNLNRIEACIYKDNTPSLKLIKHFNFTFEGNLRAHYLIGEEYSDSMLFSLLKEEWEL